MIHHPVQKGVGEGLLGPSFLLPLDVPYQETPLPLLGMRKDIRAGLMNHERQAVPSPNSRNATLLNGLWHFCR